jgi:hypothetical protein
MFDIYTNFGCVAPGTGLSACLGLRHGICWMNLDKDLYIGFVTKSGSGGRGDWFSNTGKAV